MMELNKIREAIAILKRTGIEITSFHCRPEIIAKLTSAGLTETSIHVGSTKWMENAPDDGMGRGVGSRYEITLCGIPLEQRI